MAAPPFLLLLLILLLPLAGAGADDPYRYFTWTVTYGPIAPLGTTQQGILINGQFPGPTIDCATNDNLVVTVVNLLDAPFLLTWNGVKQRKNSWQDGVAGTNCGIPPGAGGGAAGNYSYTYRVQTKDQVGTFFYFPSLALHRAAGGFGALNVYPRPGVPVPYPPPAADFTLLVGDWWSSSASSSPPHVELRNALDTTGVLPPPDGLLINGVGGGGGGGTETTVFVGDGGATYLFRVSNVGLRSSVNVRIQGHSKLRLVEVEGTHPAQSAYASLDVHAGQSLAFLVTLDQPARDYAVVASTRFTPGNAGELTAVATLRYAGGGADAAMSPPLPLPPPPPEEEGEYGWSVEQARSFRWNLTASAARPNPQGSFRYGAIPTTRTLVLAGACSSSAAAVAGGESRRLCGVNGVSFVVPDTPLKLADEYGIADVIEWDALPARPEQEEEEEGGGGQMMRAGTPVLRMKLHEFVEVVFENADEEELQAWHLDGYDFWVVGYGDGRWSETQREAYNLVDAQARHTVQVYPKGWSAILVSLDNQGMWNLRSAMWDRQYLGQQLYLRVWTPEQSLSNEYAIPDDAILCGKAAGLPLAVPH